MLFSSNRITKRILNKISFPIYVNFIRNVYALKPLILKYEHRKLLNKNQFIPIIELTWYYASFVPQRFFPHPSLKNFICNLKPTIWGIISPTINQTNTRCVYFQLWLVEITYNRKKLLLLKQWRVFHWGI